MGAFLEGVALGCTVGLGGGLALVKLRNQVHPKFASTVDRLLIGGNGPAPASVIAEIRQKDPGLAEVIDGAPAVPLSAVPAELTRTNQLEIERAASAAEAVAVARKFTADPHLADAFVAFSRWRTRRGNSEETYQRSFVSHLRQDGYGARIEEKVRVPWGGGGGSRIAIPDLILDGRVLVELKADLSKSGETDRALGQMLRYLLAWKFKGSALLAICGEAPMEMRFLVDTYVRAWREQIQLPVAVAYKQDQDDSSVAPDMPVGGAFLDGSSAHGESKG